MEPTVLLEPQEQEPVEQLVQPDLPAQVAVVNLAYFYFQECKHGNNI
jgi:hypothetical protein